jgi:hypothetical protein
MGAVLYCSTWNLLKKFLLCIAGKFLKGAGVWIYLDNSNSWIEAKRKQMMDDKSTKQNPAVRIDFDKLEKIVAQGRTVEGKFLYGSGMI